MVKVVNNGTLHEFKDIKLMDNRVSLETEEGQVFDFVLEPSSFSPAHLVLIKRTLLTCVSSSLGSNSTLDVAEVLKVVREQVGDVTLEEHNALENVKTFDILVTAGDSTFIANQLSRDENSISIIGRKSSLKLTVQKTPFDMEKTIQVMYSLFYMKRAFSRTVLDVDKFIDKLNQIYGVEVQYEEGAVFA